jgi:hypothetical protein
LPYYRLMMAVLLSGEPALKRHSELDVSAPAIGALLSCTPGSSVNEITQSAAPQVLHVIQRELQPECWIAARWQIVAHRQPARFDFTPDLGKPSRVFDQFGATRVLRCEIDPHRFFPLATSSASA